MWVEECKSESTCIIKIVKKRQSVPFDIYEDYLSLKKIFLVRGAWRCLLLYGILAVPHLSCLRIANIYNKDYNNPKK